MLGLWSGLRIVTFNCGNGGVQAFVEAMELGPDVVVLQESPPERDLQAALGRTLVHAEHFG